MIDSILADSEGDQEELERVRAKLRKHKEEADAQTAMLSAAEKDCPRQDKAGRWRTICTDLQQTLPCPKVNTQSAYYKMKLWLYNQSVVDLVTGKISYFPWTETQAERGSDEIASCLYEWVMQHINEGFKALRVITDNCAGQNKNIYIVLMFMYLIQAGVLEEVNLEFMVAGHSFLPCDRGFGVLEKKFKLREMISTPAEYMKIIGTAKKAQVTQMDHTKFYDWKNLLNLITFRKADKPVLFSKATRIRMYKDHPFKFFIESPQGSAEVNLKKRRTRHLLTSDQLLLKYPNGVPLEIQEGKLNHLQQLFDFLDSNGQKWINEVAAGQNNNPNARPEDLNPHPHLDIDEENIQDEDQSGDYVPYPARRALNTT
ncbi:MAG: hypothetical protein GY781_19940 [Gammaproteobacteria bacterium]|nr:hypothetical protein [Gammaproteobacteria bacterium]